MIYLIAYDRKIAKVLSLDEFPDAERVRAQNLRIEKEIAAHNSHQSLEIVLLEARSKDTLRRTHAKYFGSLDSRQSMQAWLDHMLAAHPA